MKLEDVTAFGETNRDLLKELSSAVGDAVDLATADRVAAAMEKAEELLAQFDEQGRLPAEVASAADRVRAADLEIARLEKERDDAVDEDDEAYFGRQLAALRQESAAWGTAAAYAGVVTFTAAERKELSKLLAEAAQDIERRRTVAGAISVTTKVVTIAAKLGVKIAKPV